MCDRAHPVPSGPGAARLLALWDRLYPDPYYDGATSEAHESIMARLPFGTGLTFDALVPMLEREGFEGHCQVVVS